MKRARLIVAAVFGAVLVVTTLGFDALGGDCGDSTAAFECNTAAYVIMGTGAIACLGLLAVGIWALLARLVARRARKGD